MNSSCFDFLSNFDEEVYSNCLNVEKHLINEEYIGVILESSKISDSITGKISEKEGFDHFLELNQFERLKELGNNGIIEFEYQRPFDELRRLDSNLNKIKIEKLPSFSNKAHRLLFDIVLWYFRKYSEESSLEHTDEIEYKSPIEHNDGQNIGEENSSKSEGIISKTSEESENGILVEHYKGSYLLGCLKNLEKGSIESIEGNNFSKFKNYLHINRSIHNEFLNEVKRVINKNSSHLIIICGSVGDGKSHLLATLNNKHPEFFSEFEILGDGTESYDYDVDSLPTLAKNLIEFNDENINDTSKNKKYILAINLGILNNFIDSEYSENYGEFKNIIKDSQIFDNEIISKYYVSEKDNISIISFTDYNLFELTGDINSNFVSSDYILGLFSKITEKNSNNPFYNAYQLDKEYIELDSEKNYDNNIVSIVDNYEMFCDEDVQRIILEYLIKISIKNKIILSTRDLLDLIYNIIVPPNIIRSDYFDREYMNGSLPCLLFNSPLRSNLLSLFKQYDPIMLNNELIDEFIIKLNISSNLKEALEEYLDFSKCPLLESCVGSINNLGEALPDDKKEFTSNLIRFLLFFGKDDKRNIFIDPVYLDFLKYLYYFNLQDHFKYIALFDDVKSAIAKHNGSDIGYLCISSTDRFKIFKTLKLEPVPCKLDKNDFECMKDDDGRIVDRFKTEISIKFKINGVVESDKLNIDLTLYEYIVKINNGYKPNKSSKENLRVFEEFINYLSSVKNNEKMHIKYLTRNYKLAFGYYEEFGEFFLESDDYEL